MKGANRLRAGRVGEVFNIASPTLPQWATYTQRRNPHFKIHKTKGQAINALSNQMPNHELVVLEWTPSRNAWIVYIDYVPPKDCERCGGPFAWSDYSHINHNDRLIEDVPGQPKYLGDILCRVCYTADIIDKYMDAGEPVMNLPTMYGTKKAFQRLMEISPEYQVKWNWLVDAHHEYKKEKDRYARLPR